LVKFWSDYCYFDVIFDLGLTWKAAQGGWKGLLDVLVDIGRELYVQLANFQILQEARIFGAVIIEGKLIPCETSAKLQEQADRP